MKILNTLLAVSAALTLPLAAQSTPSQPAPNTPVPEGQTGAGTTITPNTGSQASPSADAGRNNINNASSAAQFQGADTNNDGNLSRDEFGVWQKSQPGAGAANSSGTSNDSTATTAPTASAPNFAALDTDKNGQISREEFAQWHSSQHGKTHGSSDKSDSSRPDTSKPRN